MFLRNTFAITLLAVVTSAQKCTLNPSAFHFKFGNITGVITTDGPAIVGMNYFQVPDEAVTRSYQRVYRTTGPIVWQQNIVILDAPIWGA